MTLPPQRLAFVNAYFENDFDGAKAAIAAGYARKSARQQASRLLTNADVQAEIQRRLAAKVMSADEALQSMSQMAAFDPDSFFTIPGTFPYFDYEKARRLGVLHMVKKLKVRGDGGIEVEWYGRQRSVETMMRHHGLLKADVQINVSIELVTQAIDALQSAGIDATEFFMKAIRLAEDRRRANGGG